MPDLPETPAQRADHWLRVAEEEYEARRFEQCTAAANLASSWAQRAELALHTEDVNVLDGMREGLMRESLALDALGLNGPTGRDLRVVRDQ